MHADVVRTVNGGDRNTRDLFDGSLQPVVRLTQVTVVPALTKAAFAGWHDPERWDSGYGGDAALWLLDVAT